MKGNVIKYIFLVIIAVLLIFAIYKVYSNNSDSENSSTSNSGSTQEDQIETEIRLAIAELDTINPILSNNQNVQDVSRLMYEPLVNLSQDYKAEPCLATEWAKTSDTTYLIKIRENVKWSDGTPFTAEDVRFTIDKLKETASIYSYNVQYVTGVEVTDDYTLTITLDRAVPFFEYNLTFPIMSKAYFEGEDFANTTKNANPVGTGMFKISEVQDSNIILSKNEDWWNKENKNSILEKITININSSKAEVYNAFKMENVDLISTSNLSYTDYIGTLGYSVKEYAGREHCFLALNTQNTILSNVEVRQAILYAIDKDNIVSSVFGGNYYTSDFPLSYGSWLYDSSETGSSYNTELASEVMENAGWTRRTSGWQKQINYKTQKVSLNLLVKQSDSTKMSVAEILKNQLATMGITININAVSDETYTNNVTNRNYDLLLASTTVSASPDLSTYFGTSNLANYSNDEVTNILQEVNNTTDDDVLKEKYARLKEIYKTDVPCVSLYFSKNIVAYNTDLAGEVSSNWFNLFYNIENWYK